MYHETPWWKKMFRVVEIIIGVNIIIVDILLMQYLLQRNKQPLKNTEAIAPQETVHPSEIITVTPPVATPTSTPPAPTTYTLPQVKEYYVPFGTGQSTATDWTDVPGLQAYINPDNYPNRKQVVFEASIQVPAANQTAWVRLYDVSALHPVWQSDMYFSGGANPEYLISQPVQLGAGNDLYQVQMKTQLGSPALLLQSRLHITLQ